MGPDICLTTEVSNYRFTSAVSDRSHVESTTLLFTAVESDLSERQVSSQVIHGGFRYTHPVVGIVTDFVVIACRQPGCRVLRAINHMIGNKKPSACIRSIIGIQKL